MLRSAVYTAELWMCGCVEFVWTERDLTCWHCRNWTCYNFGHARCIIILWLQYHRTCSHASVYNSSKVNLWEWIWKLNLEWNSELPDGARLVPRELVLGYISYRCIVHTAKWRSHGQCLHRQLPRNIKCPMVDVTIIEYLCNTCTAICNRRFLLHITLFREICHAYLYMYCWWKPLSYSVIYLKRGFCVRPKCVDFLGNCYFPRGRISRHYWYRPFIWNLRLLHRFKMPSLYTESGAFEQYFWCAKLNMNLQLIYKTVLEFLVWLWWQYLSCRILK
jgi:hypothetical protein